jgi:hypothetical protein
MNYQYLSIDLLNGKLYIFEMNKDEEDYTATLVRQENIII